MPHADPHHLHPHPSPLATSQEQARAVAQQIAVDLNFPSEAAQNSQREHPSSLKSSGLHSSSRSDSPLLRSQNRGSQSGDSATLFQIPATKNSPSLVFTRQRHPHHQLSATRNQSPGRSNSESSPTSSPTSSPAVRTGMAWMGLPPAPQFTTRVPADVPPVLSTSPSNSLIDQYLAGASFVSTPTKDDAFSPSFTTQDGRDDTAAPPTVSSTRQSERHSDSNFTATASASQQLHPNSLVLKSSGGVAVSKANTNHPSFSLIIQKTQTQCFSLGVGSLLSEAVGAGGGVATRSALNASTASVDGGVLSPMATDEAALSSASGRRDFSPPPLTSLIHTRAAALVDTLLSEALHGHDTHSLFDGDEILESLMDENSNPRKRDSSTASEGKGQCEWRHTTTAEAARRRSFQQLFYGNNTTTMTSTTSPTTLFDEEELLSFDFNVSKSPTSTAELGGTHHRHLVLSPQSVATSVAQQWLLPPITQEGNVTTLAATTSSSNEKGMSGVVSPPTASPNPPQSRSSYDDDVRAASRQSNPQQRYFSDSLVSRDRPRSSFQRRLSSHRSSSGGGGSVTDPNDHDDDMSSEGGGFMDVDVGLGFAERKKVFVPDEGTPRELYRSPTHLNTINAGGSCTDYPATFTLVTPPQNAQGMVRAGTATTSTSSPSHHGLADLPVSFLSSGGGVNGPPLVSAVSPSASTLSLPSGLPPLRPRASLPPTNSTNSSAPSHHFLNQVNAGAYFPYGGGMHNNTNNNGLGHLSILPPPAATSNAPVNPISFIQLPQDLLPGGGGGGGGGSGGGIINGGPMFPGMLPQPTLLHNPTVHQTAPRPLVINLPSHLTAGGGASQMVNVTASPPPAAACRTIVLPQELMTRNTVPEQFTSHASLGPHIIGLPFVGPNTVQLDAAAVVRHAFGSGGPGSQHSSTSSGAYTAASSAIDDPILSSLVSPTAHSLRGVNLIPSLSTFENRTLHAVSDSSTRIHNNHNYNNSNNNTIQHPIMGGARGVLPQPVATGAAAASALQAPSNSAATMAVPLHLLQQFQHQLRVVGHQQQPQVPHPGLATSNHSVGGHMESSHCLSTVNFSLSGRENTLDTGATDFALTDGVATERSFANSYGSSYPTSGFNMSSGSAPASGHRLLAGTTTMHQQFIVNPISGQLYHPSSASNFPNSPMAIAKAIRQQFVPPPPSGANSQAAFDLAQQAKAQPPQWLTQRAQLALQPTLAASSTSSGGSGGIIGHPMLQQSTSHSAGHATNRIFRHPVQGSLSSLQMQAQLQAVSDGGGRDGSRDASSSLVPLAPPGSTSGGYWSTLGSSHHQQHQHQHSFSDSAGSGSLDSANGCRWS